MRSYTLPIFICFENQCKKAQVRFFLVFLLVPFQTGWLCFYLVGLLDLTREQTIDRVVRSAVSIGRKIVLDYVWSSNLITFLDLVQIYWPLDYLKLQKPKTYSIWLFTSFLPYWLFDFSCIWSLWIPLAAFVCRIWGNSSHTTTTGSGRSWFTSILVYRLMLKRLAWSAMVHIWYLILVVWMRNTTTIVWWRGYAKRFCI